MIELFDVTLFSLLIIFLLMTIAVILYSYYLASRKRAVSHLDFVHGAIKDMHPAVLDPNATNFHAWYSIAYEKAKELLPHVHSFADEKALLNFYLAGYEDSHLNGGLSRASYPFMNVGAETWLGWMLKATVSGYEVSYSLGDAYPPVGARLISCDGQSIDYILQKYFSPYIDRRWHILLARDRAAKFFTRNTEISTVLNRPNFKMGSFQLVDGTIRDYPLQWKILTPQDKNLLRTLNTRDRVLPAVKELAPGFLWVTANDFMLNSKEAYQYYQALLQNLECLQDAPTILFDLRGNQGGSSFLGVNILKSFFGKENVKFLEAAFAESVKDADAQFRVSWQLYHSYVGAVKSIKASREERDITLRFLESAIKRLESALAAQQDFFWQSELNLEDSQSQEELSNPLSWSYQGSVFFLTDQSCASACLDFIDLLKLIPESVHLGQPTNADTAYIEVAVMKHVYFKEVFNFQVPVKKWNKRMRADNEPYVPDVIYDGDICNDQKVEEWVKQQIALTKAR